ncbi:unknown [Brachyspira sp. CAG:484]|nr:unknown [Brachyspira sp. CAG:484]
MSSVKFIPAQMQKYAAHTQKMKNSQLKSTVRYMGKKAAAFTPDIFTASNKTTNTAKTSLVEIFAGNRKK